MAGDDGLIRLRKALKTDLPPAPFVGAGFSVAVTGGVAEASWVGLLKDGIRECERVAPPLPSGWAGHMRDQLENPDTISCIGIADQIVRRLREVGGGTGYDSWIQGTIGRLRPRPEGQQIVAAVRELAKKKIIVTTNYDTLIEDPEPRWESVTWTDDRYKSAQMLSQIVVHLHGLPRDPRSIILGSADYERLGTDINRVFESALFSALGFIFIGCGGGLNDPHVGLLLKLVERMYPLTRPEDTGHKRPPESYLLVRGSELRQFHGRLPSFITAVAYGRSFKDLEPFLRKLAAGEEIDVSQDPEFYAQVSAGPRRGLLDLAGPAQMKLDEVQEAVRRALHAMGQVEHRGTMPPGMSGWDYEDRRAVHEQLAASMRGPAENLLSCSMQIVPPFTDASSDLGRLITGAFDAFPADLEPLRQTVADIAEQIDLLFDRVREACADLGERIERYSSDYRRAYDAVVTARGLVVQAHDTAASLEGDLNERIRTSGGEKPVTVWLTQRRLQPSAVRPKAEQAPPAGEQRIQVRGKVAAGEAILITDEFGFLRVPPRYASPENLYALKVQGDSMIGDGIRGGDYIIVAPELDPRNGEIVVVTVPSEDGGEGNAMVKRWERQPDGSVLLRSSNPAAGPISLKEDAWPALVQGKVIGVERGEIQQGTGPATA